MGDIGERKPQTIEVLPAAPSLPESVPEPVPASEPAAEPATVPTGG